MYNAKKEDLYILGNRIAGTAITYGCEDDQFRWGWSTGSWGIIVGGWRGM
jgi:hypothetical protein